MKRFLAILLSLALMAGNVCFAAVEPERLETSDEEVTFIVEVEGDPAMVREALDSDDDTDSATEEILRAQAKVLSTIQHDVSRDAQKGFVYTSLFNGFSFDGNKNQLEEIKKLDGVKNVYISVDIPIPEPQLATAGEMTGVNTAYDLGYDGEGQVIAVIDDFLDTGHEFFQTPPKNPKHTKADINEILQTKQLNSKTVSANQVYKNAKIPYAFDYISGTADTFSSTNSHGTHVAGIAAGKNGTLSTGEKFSGIAPEAQIVFMNVSKGEYFSTAMILAAINDAALLEADVINMSFGSDYVDAASGSKKALHDSIDNARLCGISIATAAGNSSRGYDEITPLTQNPDYSSSGTPASFNSVTTVASAKNTHLITSYWGADLKDGTNLKFYSPFDSSKFPKLFTGDYVEYVYCGYGEEADFIGKDLTGKLAMIDRGVTTFKDMVKYSAEVGAIGVILVNNSESILDIAEQELPMAYVSPSTGTLLANATEKKIIYTGEKNELTAQNDSGQLSSFTAWGVDSSLQLKPEITAPGGNIYSSIPADKYAAYSGTSMATPYISGVYAIMRQYYKTNPYKSDFNGFTGAKLTDIIENITMNTADIIRNDDGVAYSPRLQGSGLVNVKNMLDGKVTITGDAGKAKVSLGEISDTFDVSFTVTNISKDSVTFDKISLELMTDGYSIIKGENYVSDTIALEAENVSLPQSITLASGEKYNFKATVKLDKTFLENNMKIFTNGFFVDGYAILDSNSDDNRAVVPFTGFYGDWYDVPIFDSTVYDKGGSTLADKDAPYNSGTFLKAYVGNVGYYYVGRNAVDNTIVDKKYISFSPESGRILSFSFKNYRAASRMRLYIEDKDKNVRYDDEIDYVMDKFYRDEYDFENKLMSTLEEGEYTLYAEATANGSDKVNDTLALPLVIDNTAPEFISAKYNEKTNTLTFSMKDNHYLSFFNIEYDGDNDVSFVITDDFLKNGIATVSLRLDGINDLNSIVITAFDYAMNYTSRTFAALTDKIGAEPLTFGRMPGMTSIKFNLLNNTGNDITGDVFVAFYDENMKMLATSSAKNSYLKCGQDNEIQFSMLADTTKAKFVKLFIWKPGSIEPIDNAKTFTLSTAQ